MPNNNSTLEIGRQSEQELVGSKKNKKLKKILIWSVIGAIAVAIIVTLVVFLTRDSSNGDSGTPTPDAPALTLEDFLDGKFSTKGFGSEWGTDNEVIVKSEEHGVILKNVLTDESTTLIGPDDDEGNLDGISYVLSPDKKFLLIAKEYRKLFRHSFAAKYFIYDVEAKHSEQIVISQEKFTTTLDPNSFLFALWNPKSNGILLNHNFNLYYMKTPKSEPIQITTDTQRSIFNGMPDWVYEEEVFSSNIASWMSPDGNLLAYVRFDDTDVRPFDIPLYGIPGDLNFQYTFINRLPYPKTGTNNPTVELFIVNLETLEAGRAVDSEEVKVPGELAGQDHIISTVAWANDVDLISVWMNRIQNHAIIQKCPAFKEGTPCSKVTDLDSTTGWIELFTAPLFNAEGNKLAIIASQPQSAAAGAFRHVTVISTEGQPEPLALTKGEFVVTDIHRWDKESNLIFYSATLPTSSESKHLFTVKAEAGAEPKCVTCDLEGGSGKYWDTELSPDGKTIVLTNSGPNVPTTKIYSWTATENNIQPTFVRTWEDNQQIESTIMKSRIPTVQYHEIDLENGFTAKVSLQLPTPLDESGNTKYPMLVDVYGGPDSNAVFNKFELGWGSFLVSNRSYIYAKIDGRGSGLRGDKLLHQIYLHMGTVEVEDQITTARKLAEKLPYIDRNRIGIWGWSYGGYAAGQALAQDTDTNHVFQCAASVAPVTDWLLYDSIYTERYMGLPTPDGNLEGYKAARLNTKFEEFRGRKYLLIHGTRDDNVHFQQAMLLARTLERNDVLFKEVSYPDEEHSLAGVRPHLYHTLGQFFHECFFGASAS